MTYPSLRHAMLVLAGTILLACGVCARAGDGSERGFHLSSLALLQPQALFGKRVSVDDVVTLTDAIVATAGGWSSELDPAQNADACSVFVAVRPDRRLKTWTSCRSFDGTALDQRISGEVDGNRIPKVKGLIVYAIHGKESGMDAFPDAWKAALEGSKDAVEISAIVDKVWPE